MKDSLTKRAALVFWAVGSIGAVLFVCFFVFGIIYTRKINFGVVVMLALGVFAAWEGLKTFKAEQNSN
jgi:hypothetical protein